MPDQSLNMRLLAHDPLGGFGGMGEGISLQLAKGGRRILWMAHESAPKNFTAVDVTDPRKPRMIVQTDLPNRTMRSNSLEIVGDIMAVAYQTTQTGMKPAGVELFDISTPEKPKSIALFDCSGPHSRGVHQVWFVDGEYIHFAGGAADFTPTNPLDDQIYRIVDVRNPSKPSEVGRWWLPGTREGDSAPPPKRHPRFDSGWRVHNTNVYPDRPDRAYIAYLDGGAVILDIADKSRPKMVGHWNPHPPHTGFTHTVLPLLDRDLLVVSDECVRNAGQDWPKLTWIVDARDESNLVPIATLPLPPKEKHATPNGRYGSHNLHENRPGPSYRSSTRIFGTYFGGGVRVHDISDPFQPKEIAYYVSATPEGSKAGSIQINDVYVDENQIVYAMDRFAGGLYTFEMTV
jgi:hypothetical protein